MKPTVKLISKIKVALADDHVLVRKGLAGIVNSFLNYEVILDASNGSELVEEFKKGQIPDIVLMDINMPVMDGYVTTQWLKEAYPHIKVLALSMYDNEMAVIRMFRSGAKGYILKDSEPDELLLALDTLYSTGYYFSESISEKLAFSLQENKHAGKNYVGNLPLTARELEFLTLACTEMTYKEIGKSMNVSPRTVDGYRDDLFLKLNLKTRVGLVLYAIKNNIVQV